MKIGESFLVLPVPLPVVRPIPSLVPLWNGIMRMLLPIFDPTLFNDFNKYNSSHSNTKS